MKKELNPESTLKEKMNALIDATEHFNSDLTQIICRDDDGKIVSVAVYAKGDYAKPLARFLKKLDKEASMPARAQRHAPDRSAQSSFRKGDFR